MMVAPLMVVKVVVVAMVGLGSGNNGDDARNDKDGGIGDDDCTP